MPADVSNFGDALTPGMTKVWVNTYKSISETKSAVPILTNPATISTPFWKGTGITGLGDIPPFQGKVEYGEPYQGYDLTRWFPEYAYGYQVTRLLYDDDMYSIFAKYPKELGRSVAYKEEEFLLDIFANATTYAPADYDAKALCASDHPTPAGSATQSNTGTVALNATNIEIARRAMLKFTDDRGKIIGEIDPNGLICHLNKEETAWEIINSKGKVETANNNSNFHFGKYKLFIWRRLPDADDWFMVDWDLMKEHLHFIRRKKPEFNHDRSFDTHVQKWSTYFRESAFWSDWRWVYGNKPA